jgi:hypothetical protein
MGIIRWKAGDSEGAMKAAMPPPETDEDNSDNQSFDEGYESNSESEYQFKLGTEFESDADAHASDAVGPRTSRSPTRKDPEGRCHLLHRWLDQADPYPQRHSSSSSFPSTSSAYTTNTGIMETETFFKAPILWKDERDQLGLRPLILVQKHDKLPHRRTICAGPGGLQPLILVEKYKKSWSWSSWNPNGSEKAEESPKLKPSVIHYVKELSMTAASTRSRLPVPAGRVSVRLGLLV